MEESDSIERVTDAIVLWPRADQLPYVSERLPRAVTVYSCHRPMAGNRAGNRAITAVKMRSFPRIMTATKCVRFVRIVILPWFILIASGWPGAFVTASAII